jgi:ABC-2 type transport system permease protein
VLSPFGAVASVCSMVLFPLLWAIVKATIMIGIATAAFGLPLRGPEALLAMPVAFVAAMSFVPFGLLVAGIVLLMKQALGAGSWIVAGISIVAGFYFPVTLLPEWMQWMSEVQPFTPTVELMRNLLVGTEMSDSALQALLRLVAFTVVLLPTSLLFIAKAIRISRRRGTVIEY